MKRLLALSLLLIVPVIHSSIPLTITLHDGKAKAWWDTLQKIPFISGMAESFEAEESSEKLQEFFDTIIIPGCSQQAFILLTQLTEAADCFNSLTGENDVSNRFLDHIIHDIVEKRPTPVVVEALYYAHAWCLPGDSWYEKDIKTRLQFIIKQFCEKRASSLFSDPIFQKQFIAGDAAMVHLTELAERIDLTFNPSQLFCASKNRYPSSFRALLDFDRKCLLYPSKLAFEYTSQQSPDGNIVVKDSYDRQTGAPSLSLRENGQEIAQFKKARIVGFSPDSKYVVYAPQSLDEKQCNTLNVQRLHRYYDKGPCLPQEPISGIQGTILGFIPSEKYYPYHYLCINQFDEQSPDQYFVIYDLEKKSVIFKETRFAHYRYGFSVLSATRNYIAVLYRNGTTSTSLFGTKHETVSSTLVIYRINGCNGEQGQQERILEIERMENIMHAELRKDSLYIATVSLDPMAQNRGKFEPSNTVTIKLIEKKEYPETTITHAEPIFYIHFTATAFGICLNGENYFSLPFRELSWKENRQLSSAGRFLLYLLTIQGIRSIPNQESIKKLFYTLPVSIREEFQTERGFHV